MNKVISLGLLVAGVVLLVLGFNSSESVSSDFSRLFTGEPTDKAIWLLICGGVLAIIGLGGLARGGKSALT